MTLFLIAPSARAQVEDIPIASGANVKSDFQTQAESDSQRRVKDTKIAEKDIVNAMNDPNYRECGLSCMYGKGNQNITLQIDFIEKKLEFLNQSNSESDKRELLGDFCKAADVIDECVKRYGVVMEFWKVKAFSAIGDNSDVQGDLVCVKRDENSGVCTQFSTQGRAVKKWMTAKEAAVEEKKKNQVPYFATAKDLEEIGKRKLKTGLNEISATEDWENEFFKQLEPTQEDYAVYRSVSESGANEIRKKKRDRSLKPDSKYTAQDFDQESYKEAHEAWKSLKAKMEKNKLFPDKPLKSRATEALKETVQKLTQGTSQSDPTKRSITQKIYDQARGENIDYVNESYKRTAAKQQAKALKNPSMPTNPYLKTPPSPTPSGQPVHELIYVKHGQMEDYKGDEKVNVTPTDLKKYGERPVFYMQKDRPTPTLRDVEDAIPDSNPQTP